MSNFSYSLPVGVMGLMSGITILISGNTMNFWLTQEGVDKTSIGIFALVSLPYAISFLWSPILDHFRIPILSKFFGMRFSWIVVLQICLSIAVYIISHISPIDNIELFGFVGFMISFLSSTQDVALGALRSKIVPAAKQGAVSGIYILGYRIGMLIASSGAIYTSVYLSWGEIYRIFANIILYFPVLLYISCINHMNILVDLNPVTDSQSCVSPQYYISLNFWKKALLGVGPLSLVIFILAYLILYRLPDNFITIMINPFLIETGFNALQIATIGKFVGIITAIIGGMIASLVMRKMKIIDALLYFGIIHALSHLLFIFQNYMGDNIYSLFFVIGAESITGGMVMAAYIAFITSLCRGKYSATQYAFFSSMMGISRAILPSLAGLIVTYQGWNNFFIFITLLTIIPLSMSLSLRKQLIHLNQI